MSGLTLRGVALAAVAVALAAPPAGTTSAAANEGQLTMLAWEGYLDGGWVKPFERRTGCKVEGKYARSSNEMVRLLRSGGGRYDLVSASGDASLGLIEEGDVAPVDVRRVPGWKQFFRAFQSPPSNTVDGKHYGISLQWGPNTLLYNTEKVRPAPTSMSVLYAPRYKGKITVPNNPLQIADAALYLSKSRPALGITDPYELSKAQFAAAIALLRKQRPLVSRYWARASEEISLFENGDAIVGAGWPYTTRKLRTADVPVAETVPREGQTGWLDSWMLTAKAKHPNCAYAWYAYVSSPKVQALQAVTFGEAPVNKLACAEMNKLERGSCARYRAHEPESYYASIEFWKTPLADCGHGRKGCMDWAQWTNAWADVVS